MYSQPALLYADAIEHLLYNMQASESEKEVRDLRHAIQQAYLDLAYEYDWKHYWTHGRLLLVAPYATGTVVYDHTGGASERLVTLTGGTFPTWAGYGRLKIGSVVYPVAKYLTSTTLQLAVDVNPGEDVASTAYTLFRSEYSLPTDFRRINDVYAQNGQFQTGYVDPSRWLREEREAISSGDSLRWTIMPDEDYPGRMELIVDPYPASASTLDFVYQRSPRPIRTTGLESSNRVGTVSNSASGTTVTGSSTAFSASMVGSFIRMGTAANHPTGLGGSYPYDEQRIITSYTSATSIEVFPAFDYAHSAVKYIISDPLDIWQGMQNAFFRNAELQLTIARKGTQGMLDRTATLARDAINSARERDAAVIASNIVASRDGEKAVGEGFTYSGAE